MKKIFLYILFFVLISHNMYSQVEMDTVKYQITTIDGNRYIGKIIHQDAKSILFDTDNLGEITIQKANIRKIEVLEPGDSVSEFSSTPLSSRYFINSSAHGLRRGEGYYQNVWIFFNQVNYGLTDNFSIGGGMVPLFLFAGTSTPFWITPRFSIPVAEDKFNLGAGALVGTIIGEGGSFGMLNGVATFGSRDRNVSFGLGYGFADGELVDLPLISFSGIYRTGERGFLLGESFILNVDGETVGTIMLGGRRLIQKVSLDFGGALPLNGEGGFFVIPWLSVSVIF